MTFMEDPSHPKKTFTDPNGSLNQDIGPDGCLNPSGPSPLSPPSPSLDSCAGHDEFTTVLPENTDPVDHPLYSS